MYARKVDDQVLTFGVSGELWRRSLVMYDLETRSKWSHILGKAMAGNLKDTQLVQIPSVMTDWKSWGERHPNTSVLWLPFSSKNYRVDFYRNPERFVLGISNTKVPHAWRLSHLFSRPVLNETADDKPVLVTFDKESITARLFSRSLDGNELTFTSSDGRIIDEQTKSTWDGVSGKCVAGKLKDKQLSSLPAFLSYRQTWKQFHPDSVMWPETGP